MTKTKAIIGTTLVALMLAVTPSLADCNKSRGTKLDPVYLDGCASTTTRPVPKFDPIYVDRTPESPTPVDFVRFVWLRYFRGVDVTLTGVQHWTER